AQINGRNSISWEDRLEMDVWYVENRSLSLDIKILWKTIFRVFKRDGINQDGYATMPDFKGNQNKDNND
ncbi:sugar transferase, partial [Candidatus Pseudothioglobus singularis]|nr:sugar transferase [Candidatus Pseudothioglobus singularis]